MRYDKVLPKSNNSSAKLNLQNDGEINSTSLKKNNFDVLTVNDVGTEEENKSIPSMDYIKSIETKMSEQSMTSKTSLDTVLQNIRKESNEAKNIMDILLNPNLTPEIEGEDIKLDLINKYNKYLENYSSIVMFIDEVKQLDKVEEAHITKLNELIDTYILNLSSLNKSIQLANQKISEIKSKHILDVANKNLNDAVSKLSYKIVLSNLEGPFFKHGHVNTTLNANVYKDNVDVTDEFDELQFVWYRDSRQDNSDEIWNSNAKRGKSLKITNDDYIPGGCLFICTLYDVSGRIITSSNMF